MIIVDTEAFWHASTNKAELLVISIVFNENNILLLDMRSQEERIMARVLLNNTKIVTWNGCIDVTRIEAELNIKVKHFDLKEAYIKNNICTSRDTLQTVINTLNINHKFTIKPKDTIHIYNNLRNMLKNERNKADISLIKQKCKEDALATYKLYKYALQNNFKLEENKSRKHHLLYGEL